MRPDAVTRLALLALAALAATVTPARAGDCDDAATTFAVTEIEAYARRATAPRPGFHHLCMEAAEATPDLVARVVAACTTIVAREPAHHACVEWTVKYGEQDLGGVALFDKVVELFPLQPFAYGDPSLALHRALGDARSAPLVRAAWVAAAKDKRARQAKHRHTWTAWRRSAIRILVKGSDADRAFLREQRAVVGDVGLVRTIDKALGGK